MTALMHTPLSDWHAASKARMAPFAGWSMPIQYAGIIKEHAHTRSKASLFDICHMGEFKIHGPGTRKSLATVVTHNLSTLPPGRCRYGFLLNEQGGILDDLIVYSLEEDAFMLVVNAARIADDFDWIRTHLKPDITMEDVSALTGKIDLQGPLSLDVLKNLVPDFNADELKYFSFASTCMQGVDVLISRTGYTGELGYELYMPSADTMQVWEFLLSDERVLPAGLGARDTLRLEAGLLLYGQDMGPSRTPAEAGYAGMLTSDASYIGKAGAASVEQRLVALNLPGRRSARHGDAVVTANGETVGVVTSGSFAPSLGHAVALAYVDEQHVDATEFMLRGPKTELEAVRTSLPFYTRGTARIKTQQT